MSRPNINAEKAMAFGKRHWRENESAKHLPHFMGRISAPNPYQYSRKTSDAPSQLTLNPQGHVTRSPQPRLTEAEHNNVNGFIRHIRKTLHSAGVHPEAFIAPLELLGFMAIPKVNTGIELSVNDFVGITIQGAILAFAVMSGQPKLSLKSFILLNVLGNVTGAAALLTERDDDTR